MIRQRVDRHGNIFPLEPAHQLPGCNLPTSEIGVIKEGPVRKWIAAKREWDTKYASAKRRVQKQRAIEMAKGYQPFGDGEVPPPSALAGRRKHGDDLKEERKKRSMGMSLWALWGSKHDEKTMKNEEEADREPEMSTATAADGQGARPLGDTKTNQGKFMDHEKKSNYSRSRSRRRTVTDEHQTEGGDDIDENTSVAELLAIKKAKGDAGPSGDGHLTPDFVSAKGKEPMLAGDPTAYEGMPSIIVHTPTVDEADLRRPKAGGIAFPFSLKQHHATASMTTLTSATDVPPIEDMRTDGSKESGVEHNAADVMALMENQRSVDGTTDNVKEGRKSLGASPLSNVTNSEEKVVENGLVMPSDRPPLETFKTAAEDLPVVGGEVKTP